MSTFSHQSLGEDEVDEPSHRRVFLGPSIAPLTDAPRVLVPRYPHKDKDARRLPRGAKGQKKIQTLSLIHAPPTILISIMIKVVIIIGQHYRQTQYCHAHSYTFTYIRFVFSPTIFDMLYDSFVRH